MKPQEMHIGQEVHYEIVNGKKSFPMTVTGIFATLHDLDDADVYLDFEGNDGDVWEVKASECTPIETLKTK